MNDSKLQQQLQPSHPEIDDTGERGGSGHSIDKLLKWPSTLRCEDCWRGWHGTCASRSAMTIASVTLPSSSSSGSVPASDGRGGGGVSSSSVAVIFLCRACLRKRQPPSSGLPSETAAISAKAMRTVVLAGRPTPLTSNTSTSTCSSSGSQGGDDVSTASRAGMLESRYFVNAATREMVVRASLVL